MVKTFRKVIPVFVLLFSAVFAAAKAPNAAQAAIIRDISQTGTGHVLRLDFVEIRECNCDAGFEIINKNSKLRSFTADAKTRVQLLKNAAEYRTASLEELSAGLAGKNFGWPFDNSTPFEFHFDGENHIREIRQIYFP